VRRAGFVFPLILMVFLGGCLSGQASVVRGTGTITYQDIEGGFYGIVSDDGERYEIMGLPVEFQVDGLRVRFEGRLRYDLASFHMWGEILQLTHVERLQSR